MSNRRKIASIAFTGAAAATVTMMGAAPTLAAEALPNFSIPWHGKLKPGTTAVQGDTTRGTTLTCRKGFMAGTVSGSASPPPLPRKLGTVKAATWSSCTGPFGLTFKEHLAGPAILIISKVLSTTSGSVTGGAGKMSGAIKFKISGTGLAAACRATISGRSIPWTSKPGSVTFNSGHKVTLRVTSATACLGALAPGDNAYFAATYVSSS